ncbi:hypothetical protein [Leptolyngbya ohadii]|uniref:hypothetical protein n=1 Tax=Leptolyngbya ohadii TaxID=1962290 RepID=UPI000B5A1A69|nr:hypothetical protein [Leptolyngbya ohadii]
MQEGSTHTPDNLVVGQSSNPETVPKFKVGDRVCWFRVPTQDFGTVVERFYGTEGSVQALGWHYTIELDPHSPSFDHCKTDYGFEDDLELLEAGGTDAAE